MNMELPIDKWEQELEQSAKTRGEFGRNVRLVAPHRIVELPIMVLKCMTCGTTTAIKSKSNILDKGFTCPGCEQRFEFK